jgi:hypothetical protein
MQVPVFSPTLPSVPTTFHSSCIATFLKRSIRPAILPAALLLVTFVQAAEVIAVFEVHISKPLRIAITPGAFKNTALKKERTVAMPLAVAPLPRVCRAIAPSEHTKALALATWIAEAQVLIVEFI